MKFSCLNSRCGFLLYHFRLSFSFLIWASCLTVQFILIIFSSSFYSIDLISVCLVLFFHPSLTQLCHVTTLTCTEYGSIADRRPCNTVSIWDVGIYSEQWDHNLPQKAIAYVILAFSFWQFTPRTAFWLRSEWGKLTGWCNGGVEGQLCKHHTEHWTEQFCYFQPCCATSYELNMWNYRSLTPYLDISPFCLSNWSIGAETSFYSF